MRAALEAVGWLEVGRRVVAVPTAHARSLDRVAPRVDAIVCANVRSGARFAVADAYERWYDVSEDEAAEILAEFAG